MKLSQMGSIFIEIFDVKVLNAIYPKVYISRQYGNCILNIFYYKPKEKTFFAMSVLIQMLKPKKKV